MISDDFFRTTIAVLFIIHPCLLLIIFCLISAETINILSDTFVVEYA